MTQLLKASGFFYIPEHLARLLNDQSREQRSQLWWWMSHNMGQRVLNGNVTVDARHRICTFDFKTNLIHFNIIYISERAATFIFFSLLTCGSHQFEHHLGTFRWSFANRFLRLVMVPTPTGPPSVLHLQGAYHQFVCMQLIYTFGTFITARQVRLRTLGGRCCGLAATLIHSFVPRYYRSVSQCYFAL